VVTGTAIYILWYGPSRNRPRWRDGPYLSLFILGVTDQKHVDNESNGCNVTDMAPKNDIPSPEMLLVEAQGAVDRDAPIDMNEYGAVIGQLRGKNYSFGKIAEWLGERLGRSINKGAVYRSYQTWLQLREEEGFGAPEFEPPDDEDELNHIIQEYADDVLAWASKAARGSSHPEWMAKEGIRRAAAMIEQEDADERAAEDADKTDGVKNKVNDEGTSSS